jgi:tRNA:m4X modification enzyme
MLSAKGRVKGLSIATCCHHRCDTKTYVNLPFIESLGISLTAFDQFVTRSSYAVSPGDDVEKRAAGFMVKRLLDLGRVLFIGDQMDLKVDGV